MTRRKTRDRADFALVIFAKAPIPGQVKTRLCPPLTPDEAATLHGSFVLDTLERTKVAVATFHLPAVRILACAPSSTHVFFKIMEERHGVRLLDQEGRDLGERMHAAFEKCFAQGFTRVVLVGTDVPSLPLNHYREAFDALATHDLVLGPAQDGGYYLIGLTRPAPELFRDVPWSDNRVLAATRNRADRAGLRTALLPVWRDIDTIDDLQALIQESANQADPHHARNVSMRTAGALALIAKRLRTRA
ncbi:MAG TPA: TIGR04282 family arsenosugar biosynthesis glycosyltransferase [Nitrospiraceae bacterium]|nr:TIGR04282 family arsenosugar biosynthesis glycosyltransferase [Nitrospiraceae bacterium]